MVSPLILMACLGFNYLKKEETGEEVSNFSSGICVTSSAKAAEFAKNSSNSLFQSASECIGGRSKLY